MKVALCISGQMRQFELAYGSIKKYILDPLSPDVFIFTEKQRGITNRVDFEGSKSKLDIVDKEEINSFFNPTELEFFDPPKNLHRKLHGVRIPDELVNAESPPQSPNRWKGNLPNFYGIYKCNQMKSNYEYRKGFNYDLVIRLRPDLALHEPLPEKVLTRNDTIWHEQTTDIHVSDKLAMSSSENMDYYSSVWTKLQQYWKSPLGGGKRHQHRVGERLLLHHLNMGEVSHRKMGISTTVMRHPDFAREIYLEEMSISNHLSFNNFIKAIKNPKKAIDFIKIHI
jgi:hypothetical protein